MQRLAESSIATRDSAKLVSSQLPLLLDQFHGTITKTNSLLDSTQVAMVSANRTINAASDTLLATHNAVTDFDVRMADTLASLHPMFQAGESSLISVKRFIDGPATEVAKSTNGVLVPTGWLMYDLQQKEHQLFFPPPYTGKHPTWNKTKNGLLFVPRLLQPTYYGVKLVRDR